MIRSALILAAGRGRPVADPEVPNCLAEVGGTPLILRWLRLLRVAGITRAVITVGWKGAELRNAVEEIAARERDAIPQVVFFDNPAWDGPNGLSVLAARPFVSERTLLVMADQIA